MSATYDAIIVGAGVAGSTAAILLAHAGWSVVLVEKHEFPRRKVCGEALSAGNLTLLDELGIGREFAELAGPPLRRAAIFVGGAAVTADLPRFDDSKHQCGRARASTRRIRNAISTTCQTSQGRASGSRSR